MKRGLFALAAVVLMVVSSGCANNCVTCGSRGGARATARGAAQACAMPSGPPTAQVAYPYYTVRGPRDFFLDDPQPLGP